MNFLNAHKEQIVGLLVVAILLTVGRKPLLAKTRGNKALMWLAFAVTIICGLILGWALRDVVSWATQLSGIAFVAVALAGSILAVWAGWHAVSMLVDLIRDVMDTSPDDDARKAALWIPTLLPAGGQAVWGIVTNPRGLGTGVAAAIIAGLTIAYVGIITRKALQGKTARTMWLWFSAAVCLLGGLAATPLILYVDGWIAGSFPAWLIWWRIVGGVLGVALGIAAAVDIADKVPDAYVRSFLRFGLPLVLAFGAVGVSAIAGGATNGAALLGVGA